MKNLIQLVEREDVHAYVRDLWKSDIFRKSYDERGFIYDQVESFARLPRLFAEETNDHLERAHFSTWWNVIMLREYDSSIVHDLYYLHEFCHAATMPYEPHASNITFARKMQRNELEASVLSEIRAYFEMPELRSSSFPYEIYADRFLNNPKMHELWKINPKVAIETITSMRHAVMECPSEVQMDNAEKWINRFSTQNKKHAEVWSDSRVEVEIAMVRLQYESNRSGRAIALTNHIEWLEAIANMDSEDHIPFRREAENFSTIYWDGKKEYAEEMTYQTSSM